MYPTPLLGHYDYKLVAVSIFIAILASYAALDLAGRIFTARGVKRLAWLCGGAVAMGTGIWAMHYVGMEAFHLPVPVEYDWPTVLLSLEAAIGASGVALFVASRPTMGRYRALAGSIVMGSGIAAMHYIGMAAMRLPAMCVYNPALVLLSVVLAIVISFGALQLTFLVREQRDSWSVRKLVSAVTMGLAIPVMHYVGMAAVTFTPLAAIRGDIKYSIDVSDPGLASIVIVTLLVLVLAIVSAFINRHLMRQAQELRESRQQLQAIFDNMEDGIIVLDSNRNIVQVNPAACRLLGIENVRLSHPTTDALYEVLSPGGKYLATSDWPSALALRGQFLHYEEFEIRRKDTGKTVIVEISTTPIKDIAGVTGRIIVSYRNITERKEHLNTRARLAAIVDSSEDAIIGKDEFGLVRSWNAAAERIFGYAASEMIGESILRLVPSDREEEEREFLDRIKGGEVIDHIETMGKRKDGKLIHVSVTISPIRDADNRVIGASKTARDITARKQLEHQLFQSQKMEAIGQLTGGIAHDFNNLLGVIIGNLGLLERMLPEEKSLKHIRTAQKAAWRGADLIRRLLTFSSNEGLKPCPTSLTDTIQNLIDLASRAIGPEIAIQTRLDDSIPLIFVDSAGLETALLNLAVNARDAMPKGGTLTIATELKKLDERYPGVKTGELSPGYYACISMTDTGFGMSQETLARVFEPFFTTKAREKGTGLGLAMVYGFTRQSHGAVRIYSELDYGTTVALYLPLAGHISTQQAVAMPATHRAEHRDGTALVVDDNLDMLEIASTYLAEMGYVCLAAGDGVSALEVVSRTKNIDLIVTDVIMPGRMNGVELVQQIREIIPEIKVIYSSGFSADALAERSGTIVDGLLLHKPYQQTEFNAAVQHAMGVAIK